MAFGRGKTAASPALYVIGRPSAGESFGVYQSLDEGASFRRISDPDELGLARAAAMDADMRHYGRVYVGMSGRGILMARALDAD